MVGVILQLQTERFKDPAEHGPVLVLGCSDWQRQVLKDELLRLQTILHSKELQEEDSVTAELPVDITNEMPSSLRTELYQTKACLFVTTRILVVDLLNSVVQPKQVAGLVVMNVHRVQDTSGEGFAARLFRSANQQGFIRGFSDNANSVSGGFAKAWPPEHYAAGTGLHGSEADSIDVQPEKMMKALFVRKLFLWPRWEAHVKDVLDHQAIEVCRFAVFLLQTLSSYTSWMTQGQACPPHNEHGTGGRAEPRHDASHDRHLRLPGGAAGCLHEGAAQKQQGVPGTIPIACLSACALLELRRSNQI